MSHKIHDLKTQPIFEIKELDDKKEHYLFKMWFPPPGTNLKLEWKFERMTLKRLKRRIERALGPENLKDFLR